ncbi:MAG: hypothetical protein JXB85_13695 [Anaerolineales bacterium]|nr:hypothetical protein [Anaerolineales bacterium]
MNTKDRYMAIRNLLGAGLLGLLLTTCGLPATTEIPATPVPTSTFTPIPTLTPALSPTPEPFTPPAIDPAWVLFDFATNMCTARWGNSLVWFELCPANRSDPQGGFYAFLDQPGVESLAASDLPAITVLPTQGAVFGEFPPILIQAGDIFQATIACEGDAPCNVSFALEYMDQNGTYHPNANDGIWPWEWRHQAGDGPVTIAADLSGLAGLRVQLVLAVRDRDGDPESNYALWVQPLLLRDPSTRPAPTSQTPGAISGFVAMAGAPPYLYDDPGSVHALVVVVAINQQTGAYQYDTTGEAYSYAFTLPDLPPGNYWVVAYAQGVGDVEYVTAAYTGASPSCGQATGTIHLLPGQEIGNVPVNDWQWTCGGTADRPAKPADVPIP